MFACAIDASFGFKAWGEGKDAIFRAGTDAVVLAVRDKRRVAGCNDCASTIYAGFFAVARGEGIFAVIAARTCGFFIGAIGNKGGRIAIGNIGIDTSESVFTDFTCFAIFERKRVVFTNFGHRISPAVCFADRGEVVSACDAFSIVTDEFARAIGQSILILA